MIRWTNLYTRRGTCIPQPTKDQLRQAIQEVFATSDLEHPDAWIECGSENGPLHTLAVSSGGALRYTKHSDADMTEELETATQAGVTEDQAFHAWLQLMNEAGS